MALGDNPADLPQLLGDLSRWILSPDCIRDHDVDPLPLRVGDGVGDRAARVGSGSTGDRVDPVPFGQHPSLVAGMVGNRRHPREHNATPLVPEEPGQLPRGRARGAVEAGDQPDAGSPLDHLEGSVGAVEDDGQLPPQRFPDVLGGQLLPAQPLQERTGGPSPHVGSNERILDRLPGFVVEPRTCTDGGKALSQGLTAPGETVAQQGARAEARSRRRTYQHRAASPHQCGPDRAGNEQG